MDRWSSVLRRAVLTLILCYALAPAAPRAENNDLLSELKVAYIFNFTRFIEWPETAANRPFVIAVIGDPGMEKYLRVLERSGRQVQGRRIEIRSYPNPEAISADEILFVGRQAVEQLDTIVKRTSGQPTLLVGDAPGYSGRGLAIELFRKPDVFRKSERLRFRIDPNALRNRGLIVSAQLYDVAEVLE